MFMGSKLLGAFNLCKHHINNALNPIWNTLPEAIPSGVNKATLLHWVRSKAWPVKAQELAKLSVRKKYCKQFKGTNQKISLEQHADEISEGASRRIFKSLVFSVVTWITLRLAKIKFNYLKI